MTTHFSPTPSANFSQVRDLLLDLHQELLQFERQRYESLYGRVQNNGDFFGIVVNQPAFAWLRKLSELVVVFDEYMNQKAALKNMDEQQIMAYTKVLLTPKEDGEEFAQKYFVAIQNSPDVAILQVKIQQKLK